MIIMSIKADNLFSFKDFELNFSYPKKIVNSTIENEFLESKPNFRYKKLITLMGANASGKTSLGKLLKAIFNFIHKKDILKITNAINDPSKKTSFSIDFLLDEDNLYRINFEKKNKNIKLDIYCSKILKNYNYEKTTEKFIKISKDDDPYIKKLELIPNFGWLFTFPGDDESKCGILKDDLGVLDIKVLNSVLKTLDASILSIEKSEEVENSYIIRSTNGDVFVQNGEIIKNNILSSGTKVGIDISYIISSMIKSNHKFYYCDEKFTYIQSDVEIALLSIMIELLPKNSQLFFTTHNLDVLDMNLPVHSFVFLRKKYDVIEVIDPKDFVKKNDISLRNAVKNDIFDIAPDVNSIFELEGVL